MHPEKTQEPKRPQRIQSQKIHRRMKKHTFTDTRYPYTPTTTYITRRSKRDLQNSSHYSRQSELCLLTERHLNVPNSHPQHERGASTKHEPPEKAHTRWQTHRHPCPTSCRSPVKKTHAEKEMLQLKSKCIPLHSPLCSTIQMSIHRCRHWDLSRIWQLPCTFTEKSSSLWANPPAKTQSRDAPRETQLGYGIWAAAVGCRNCFYESSWRQEKFKACIMSMSVCVCLQHCLVTSIFEMLVDFICAFDLVLVAVSLMVSWGVGHPLYLRKVFVCASTMILSFSFCIPKVPNDVIGEYDAIAY